jgi:hypothetical protein
MRADISQVGSLALWSVINVSKPAPGKWEKQEVFVINV